MFVFSIDPKVEKEIRKKFKVNHQDSVKSIQKFDLSADQTVCTFFVRKLEAELSL